MGMTDQLHAPGALTLGNEPRNLLKRTPGVSKSRWWRFWKNTNILYLPRIEPHIPSSQAFGLLSIPAPEYGTETQLKIARRTKYFWLKSRDAGLGKYYYGT